MHDTSKVHILHHRSASSSIPIRHSNLNPPKPTVVYMVRAELTKILDVYGKMVVAGQWHDYALDTLTDIAIFSIYRRASERPLYRVIKEPALGDKQGAWRITNTDGRILKRGKKLEQLLRFFDPLLLKTVT
ncbi:MAG: hypothetical protein COB37_02675 [Kordiimonadales bacterium]|nr:MAG: hypothetical protein COB37_02675 [Kordiimonadales bacterium]